MTGTWQDPVLVVGAQRSGTTALAAAVRAACEQAGGRFTINARLPHLLRRWLTTEDLTGRQFRSDEVVRTLAAYGPTQADPAWVERTGAALDRAAGRIAAGQTADHLSEAALICRESYGAGPDRPWGDKYNEYLLDLDYLHRVFPRARWVFLARHPVEVVDSALRWNKTVAWHLASEDALHAKWAAWNRNWLAFRDRLAPSLRVEVSYEELCRGRIEPIEALIGLPLGRHLTHYRPRPKAGRYRSSGSYPAASRAVVEALDRIGLALRPITVPIQTQEEGLS